MQIQKLTNANVYIDGTDSLLGRAETVTLPEISLDKETHKSLGMIGSVELPTTLAPMMAKFKWAGFYAEALKLGGNPFAGHRVQVRGSVEVFSVDGLVEEKAAVIHMTGRFTRHGLGEIAAGTSNAQEQDMAVTYLKVVLDQKDVLEIDVMNQIWRVDGKDVRAKYRANLGL